MNKLINRVFIVVAIAGVLGMSSCGEEPWDLQDDGAGGRLLANFTGGSTGDNFFFGTTTSVTWDLGIVSNPGVSVSSVEVFLQLSTANNGDSENVSVGSFTGVTAEGITLTFTDSEMFSNVPVGGNVLTEDDLSPGDTWTFTYEMTLGDGTVLSGGTNSSHTVTFTCISTDITGTWTATTTACFGDGAGNCAGNFGLIVYTVTITEVSPGTYELSDLTGGVYGSPSGYGDGDNPGNVVDICNVLSITDQPDVIYGGDVFNGSGTLVDANNFTISWSNGWGDAGTSVYVRQ